MSEYLSTFKVGRGKSAVPALAMRSYQTLCAPCYEILHLPSLTLVADGFYFASTARSICNTLIQELPAESLTLVSAEKLAACFPFQLRLYLEFYRFSSCKKPLDFTEWINGPEHQAIFDLASSHERHLRASQELAEGLHSGNQTLAWVPTNEAGLSSDDMADLTYGRRLSSEIFHI